MFRVRPFYASDESSQHDDIHVEDVPVVREADAEVHDTVTNVNDAVGDVVQEGQNLTQAIADTPPVGATKQELEAWKNDIGGKLDNLLARFDESKNTVEKETEDAANTIVKKVKKEKPTSEQQTDTRKPNRKRGFRRY